MQMKNMKLLKSLFLIAPLAIVLAGCTKFLDRKPLRSTLDDLNQGSLEQQILGMYNTLKNYVGFSGLPWIDFHSIRGDDAQKGSDANDGREIIAEFETFQYSKDDWAPNTYWNDHFTMINQANEALALAEEEKPTDAASQRNIGEALFFRAYSYWELVKTYGEVPLINFKLEKPSDGFVAKAAVPRLYEFIDSNLAAAVELLPLTDDAYGPGYDGRLTRGAANTLWAETYLFRKDWAKVIALTNTVIASGVYSLNSNFSDNFREWKDGVNGGWKNSPESIFEMQATIGANGVTNGAVNQGAQWGTAQQIRRNSAPEEWNLGWGWNTPTDKLEAAWPDSDPRKRKTILYSGEFDGGEVMGGFGATLPPYTNPDGTGGGFAQKFWSKKLYTGNDPRMRQFTGFTRHGEAGWINKRIFRYAEVLLMLAEAANEAGDGATAAANLELIRNRASGNLGRDRTVLPYIPFTSQSQMREAIINERNWELAMEGKRFYDLVRWDRAISELSSLGYTNRARYYPIPQRIIDLSGGIIKQNPEW